MMVKCDNCQSLCAIADDEHAGEVTLAVCQECGYLISLQPAAPPAAVVAGEPAAPVFMPELDMEFDFVAEREQSAGAKPVFSPEPVEMSDAEPAPGRREFRDGEKSAQGAAPCFVDCDDETAVAGAFQEPLHDIALDLSLAEIYAELEAVSGADEPPAPPLSDPFLSEQQPVLPTQPDLDRRDGAEVALPPEPTPPDAGPASPVTVAGKPFRRRAAAGLCALAIVVPLAIWGFGRWGERGARAEIASLDLAGFAGGTLYVSGTVAGVDKGHEVRVTVFLRDSRGVRQWEKTVRAGCGQAPPLPGDAGVLAAAQDRCEHGAAPEPQGGVLRYGVLLPAPGAAPSDEVGAFVAADQAR